MVKNLKFPNRLIFHFVDSSSQIHVPNLAIILTVFAMKKNNYSIARVTDIDGSVIITQAEMKASIVEDKKLFIMDYSSSLDECYPEIQVKVCTSEEAKKVALAMKTFKKVRTIDELLIKGFEECQNSVYIPLSKKLLLDQESSEKNFEIEVSRIPRK